MKVLTIFDDVPEKKIFTPKTRRLFPKQKKLKRKTSSDNDNFKFNTIKISETKCKEKILDLEKITIDEINKDFLACCQSLEEEKFYDEINNILSCSTKDTSFDCEFKKTYKIKRPNCPIDKNVEKFDDNFFFNSISESDKDSQIN